MQHIILSRKFTTKKNFNKYHQIISLKLILTSTWIDVRSSNKSLLFTKRLLLKWVLLRKLKQSTRKSSKTAQYNLDRQTAKDFAFSSGNVSKHEFLFGKDNFLENKQAKKAAGVKTLEYFPLEK